MPAQTPPAPTMSAGRPEDGQLQNPEGHERRAQARSVLRVDKLCQRATGTEGEHILSAILLEELLLPPAVSPAGSVTLLLGPPGAGKSVFMQTLSGRLQAGPNVRVRAPAASASVVQAHGRHRVPLLLCRVVDHAFPPRLSCHQAAACHAACAVLPPDWRQHQVQRARRQRVCGAAHRGDGGPGAGWGGAGRCRAARSVASGRASRRGSPCPRSFTENLAPLLRSWTTTSPT